MGESDISLIILFLTSLNFVNKSNQQNRKKISIKKMSPIAFPLEVMNTNDVHHLSRNFVLNIHT